MKKILFAVLLLSAPAFLSAQEKAPLPYQDRSLTPEERADDLISRLTLEEKASLIVNGSAPVPRLGIRQYNWWSEAAHGVANNSATCYPNPIAMAASFDDSLVLEVFTATSDEARVLFRLNKAKGPVQLFEGLTFWTPNINIFRDPRWGRGQETYGEDPYLTGKMALSVIRGMQGDDNAAIRKAHACVKHYAVHSGPESLRHSMDVDVSEKDLRETYLPAFREAVVKGNVEEVMTAYQSFRGKPCGASDYLIDTLLRGEWGFKGLITSDCGAIDDFYREGHHRYVETPEEAAALGVRSGVDTECGSVYAYVPDAVEKGLLDEKDIDRNLKRLLVARYRLGEMDDIDPWSELPDDLIECPEHKALSRKMAGETTVLLKNDGILPLKEGQRVALVGPNADDREMMWGNYNPSPKRTVTLRRALEGRIPGLVYTKGCGLMGHELMPESAKRELPDTSRLEEIAKARGIPLRFLRYDIDRTIKFRAVFQPELNTEIVLRQLDGIDTVVFAGGISARLEGEQMPVMLPGFDGGDRTDIELPAVQLELLAALKEAGKKIIFVNFSGSAINMEPMKENCNAILQAWYPGDEGGEALADIIYGKIVPSGKLPLTFYKSVDQLPEFINYDMKGHTYRYFDGEPSYPFGYGLSYTVFKYRRPRIRGNAIVVKVKNTGKRDATEVVQLYVRRPGDADGPIKTLRGFKRVSIPAGKSVKVRIPLSEETFLWWDEAAQKMAPAKGKFVLAVGGSSADKDLKTRKYTVK